MRSLALLVSVVVSSIASAAVTGSGVKLSETRKIAAFSKIDVSDGVQLEIRKGATSLVIEGDDNVVPLYVTEVVGDELRIHRNTKDWLRTKVPLVVKVTTPSLSRLEASGGVEALVDGVAAAAFELY
ncbi:MAG: GIN domain-containing protein, partial [Myxococcota bacterium]